MPRPCNVCNREEYRLQIDQRLRDGEPCSVIAQEFGLSPDAVERHKRSHVLGKPRNGTADPVAILREIVSETSELSRTAKLTGDVRAAVDAVGKQLTATVALIERESKKEQQEAGQNDQRGLTMAALDRIVATAERDFDPCPACGALSIPKLAKVASERSEINLPN